jgi:hypothetical protein
VEVGEVTAAASRDGDLLTHPVRVFEKQHPAAAFPRLDRAEQSGGAATDDYYIAI